MTFKEMYGKYNEKITPAEELVWEINARALGKTKEAAKTKFISILRPAAAVAAACLCLLVTMPVLADGIPYVEQLLNLISPELAQQFVPVQLSDEADGIRMEVKAIKIQEDGAQVYVTLQDLEGDRLDETTDLYDSYHLNIPYDSVSHCSNLGYDSETGTVTFLISISPMDEGAPDDWYEKIKHQRITFSIREIIGQKKEYEDVEIPIPLVEADMDAESMGVHLRGYGYSKEVGERLLAAIRESNPTEPYPDDPRSVSRVLRPGEVDSRFPVDGILFTGMGYVNGLLHVQYAVENHLENDNHGHFFLKDAQGNERMYDAILSFSGSTEETRHIGYEDCVFDIPVEELSDYTLHGYFVTSHLRLDGGWKVKFRLEQGE